MSARNPEGYAGSFIWLAGPTLLNIENVIQKTGGGFIMIVKLLLTGGGIMIVIGELTTTWRESATIGANMPETKQGPLIALNSYSINNTRQTSKDGEWRQCICLVF